MTALDEAGTHPAYPGVLAALAAGDHDARCRERDARQREHRMTWPLGGDRDRLLPLDLVPRIVEPAEWQAVSDGLTQRVRALDALLLDLAGGRECVRAGVLPETLADGAPIVAPGATASPVTVAGIDLLRCADGWQVLEDNLRVPSGLAYAMLVREVSAAVLPGLSEGLDLADPRECVPLLAAALEAAAPLRCEGPPSIAVLTAGPTDSAHAEHSLLAARLGVPLVTCADLSVVRDRLHGPDGALDVLYRRLDEDELTVLDLGDGSPALQSLTELVCAGTLGLANALGTGVADDKALYVYVPALIDFFLGEKPLLADVRTWVLADPDALAEALPRLHELVVKPVDGYGGRGVTFGAELTAVQLAELHDRLRAEPEAWVAQECVSTSTHPTHDATGALEPRCVDLRAFVVMRGREATTLPAALTRVAPADDRIVNSSAGGGTKDTWLLRS